MREYGAQAVRIPWWLVIDIQPPLLIKEILLLQNNETDPSYSWMKHRFLCHIPVLSP